MFLRAQFLGGRRKGVGCFVEQSLMMCVTNKAEIKTRSRDRQLCVQNKLEAGSVTVQKMGVWGVGSLQRE